MTNKKEIQCNIVLIDDDKKLCEQLLTILQNGFGHTVCVYHDKKTFKEAANKGVFNKLDDKPLIIILDIMMAEELKPGLAEAPRLDRETRLKGDYDPKNYRDDLLGLHMTKQIREGEYAEAGIDRDVPIIFLTARQNADVVDEILQDIKYAEYLPKPQNMYEIQKAIEKVIER